MAGASVPHSAGDRRVAEPGAEGICDPLPMGEPASPWARDQECAHKLSAYAKQPPVGCQYVGEGTPRIGAWSAPCYDETLDDDNYQLDLCALACIEPSLAHPGIARGRPERLSHRDWYEAPARNAPAPFPRQEEFGVP